MKFIKINICDQSFNYLNFDIRLLRIITSKYSKILVTGGSSINYFLKKIINFKSCKNVFFYLSDDRLFCKKKNSNSFKINKIFDKFTNTRKFFGIKNYPKDITKEMMRYEKLLPNHIDIAFLSLGKSHHLASLFPKMKVYFKTKNLILSSAKGFKYKRISINKHFLSKCKKIYILINGKTRLNDLEVMVKKKIFNNYFSVKSQKKIILIFRNIKKK